MKHDNRQSYSRKNIFKMSTFGTFNKQLCFLFFYIVYLCITVTHEFYFHRIKMRSFKIQSDNGYITADL